MSAILLKLLPYRWIGIGLVVMVLLGVIASDKVAIAGLRVKVADGQRVLSDYLREHAAAARASEAAARREEDRRAAAQRKADDDRELQLATARADAAIADAAAGRLRDRYAALVTASREAARNPASAASGAPAASGDLQADVLGGVLEIARQYVAAAEDAITRGELAERHYGALTAPTLTLPPMKLGAP